MADTKKSDMTAIPDSAEDSHNSRNKGKQNQSQNRVSEMNPALAAALCQAGRNCQAFKKVFPTEASDKSDGNSGVECPAKKCSAFDKQFTGKGKNEQAAADSCACGNKNCQALACPVYRFAVRGMPKTQDNSKCPAYHPKCPAFQAASVDDALKLGCPASCPAYKKVCPAFDPCCFKKIHGDDCCQRQANGAFKRGQSGKNHWASMFGASRSEPGGNAQECPAYHPDCPAFQAGNLQDALKMGNISSCPAYNTQCPAFQPKRFEDIHGSSGRSFGMGASKRGCGARGSWCNQAYNSNNCGCGNAMNSCGGPAGGMFGNTGDRGCCGQNNQGYSAFNSGRNNRGNGQFCYRCPAVQAATTLCPVFRGNDFQNFGAASFGNCSHGSRCPVINAAPSSCPFFQARMQQCAGQAAFRSFGQGSRCPVINAAPSSCPFFHRKSQECSGSGAFGNLGMNMAGRGGYNNCCNNAYAGAGCNNYRAFGNSSRMNMCGANCNCGCKC